MDELIQRLAADSRIVDGMVVMEFYESGSVHKAVDLETFRGFFESALDSAEPGTEYQTLLAADDNGDGTVKGYARYFEEWYSAGLI